MLDPRIETAFRNAASTLRDSEGNPPTEKRILQMLAKFTRLVSEGQVEDASYIEAIGRGWPHDA